MTHKVTNTQVIRTSQEKAFNAIIECEKWPEFLPGCKMVEVLQRSDRRMVRRMHSLINNQVVKMVTECFIFPTEHCIEYRQIEVPWPLQTNGGSWIIKNRNDGSVEMELTHVFTVKFGILGDLAAWMVIGPYYIYRHNKKVLQQYASYLEN
jgi:ribosome-associated toxin RatA of RatAB toxin-antitoxin module